MRPILVGAMFVLSFLFAVLLAVSMKLFLFNIVKPFLYSDRSSAVFLNLLLNISSYIPLMLAGFFLNFTNYPEIRHHIWNTIWSIIFGITIFNFLKIGMVLFSAYISFPSYIVLYLWENILPYLIAGILITFFSLLIKKRGYDKKSSLLPAFLTILWLILLGKLKLNSFFQYFLAIFAAILPSVIIVELRRLKAAATDPRLRQGYGGQASHRRNESGSTSSIVPPRRDCQEDIRSHSLPG